MVDEQQDEISVEAEPPVVNAPKPTTAETVYVLLVKGINGEYNVGPNPKTISGRSPEAAIRTYAESADLSGAVTFVAVPERSWRPLTVTPKVTTTLTVEEAK